MICETCRRGGRPGFVPARRHAREDKRRDPERRDPGAMIPCPDCGGHGIAHCCDGICEQPDVTMTKYSAPKNAPKTAPKTAS
ncbi:MAG: hypothetical protein QOI12_3743 [Alphaproteobacteria bacterium]|jgi:hypothetical protein|nr:hypothetical protein [Alphaproteobacteria bacterium]